jgi:hypothetical protein
MNEALETVDKNCGKLGVSLDKNNNRGIYKKQILPKQTVQNVFMLIALWGMSCSDKH